METMIIFEDSNIRCAQSEMMVATGIRILLVDGLNSALEPAKLKRPNDVLKLNIEMGT